MSKMDKKILKEIFTGIYTTIEAPISNEEKLIEIDKLTLEGLSTLGIKDIANEHDKKYHKSKKELETIISNIKFKLLADLTHLGVVAKRLKYEEPLTIKEITMYDDIVKSLQKVAEDLKYSDKERRKLNIK